MKRFLQYLICFCLPILGIAIFTIYETVTFPKEGQGDLGRLGWVSFEGEYNQFLKSLAVDSYDVKDVENICGIDGDSTILTIGDSFSQMKEQGYQAFLQNYYPGFKIYNYTGKDDQIERFQWFVDILKDDCVKLPKIVILEMVERSLYHRLFEIKFSGHNTELLNCQEADFNEISSEENMVTQNEDTNTTTISDYWNDVKNTMTKTQDYIRKSINLENPVKRVKLNDTFFSCKGHENELVYYRDDLIKMPPARVDQCRQNLDSIFFYASKRDIKFLFVVTSDKYHLYKEYTVNDKKKSVPGQLTYFEDYSKSPLFFNTRDLLSEHLKNKEIDLYKCHDSHWSAKASKYVAEEIYRRLNAQEINNEE